MNLETMRMARALEELGGLRVLGNHDAKIGKWLMGRDVRVGPHQESTIREFDSIGAEERAEWGAWMLDAEGHYLLDDGRLAVAHAGIDEENQGRVTGGAMSFALYGKPDPENRLDEEGYPIAEDWAATYGGDATVVHGHIVHDAPREMNNVIAIDTGCVFGGDLTALRWPERTYERVPARQEWWKRR
jgi:protein phosphatase